MYCIWPIINKTLCRSLGRTSGDGRFTRIMLERSGMILSTLDSNVDRGQLDMWLTPPLHSMKWIFKNFLKILNFGWIVMIAILARTVVEVTRVEMQSSREGWDSTQATWCGDALLHHHITHTPAPAQSTPSCACMTRASRNLESFGPLWHGTGRYWCPPLDTAAEGGNWPPGSDLAMTQLQS